MVGQACVRVQSSVKNRRAAVGEREILGVWKPRLMLALMVRLTGLSLHPPRGLPHERLTPGISRSP
jgi:hypothetical protein